jgi:hypothetical protein
MNSAKPPSPAEVEERALQYQALDIQIDAIAKSASDEIAPLERKLEDLKIWFVDAAREFGSTHAEKSKILHGIEMEAMVTIGQSNSIDSAAVETFRLALVKADRKPLLQHLFERDVRWTLAANAMAYIREHKHRFGAKLLALALQCFVTKDKAPQLTVRPKQKAA